MYIKKRQRQICLLLLLVMLWQTGCGGEVTEQEKDGGDEKTISSEMLQELEGEQIMEKEEIVLKEEVSLQEGTVIARFAAKDSPYTALYLKDNGIFISTVKDYDAGMWEQEGERITLFGSLGNASLVLAREKDGTIGTNGTYQDASGKTTELFLYEEVHESTELSGIKGVNLGNWLVLEEWMSPYLFEGTAAKDEVSLAQMLPAEDYKERMTAHREEYITERDFMMIAAEGFNAVRIPIPYYIFGDREPFVGCIEFLDHAFDWAEKYGIKILIDMHMVPGSQNGFDNGGFSGVCKWAGQPEEVEYVIEVLEKLARRYGWREALLGIEPVNEPMVSEMSWEQMNIIQTYPPVNPEDAIGSAPVSIDFLKEFYLEVYYRLRKCMPEDVYIIYHDGFRLYEWQDFMQGEEFVNVAFDTHQYLTNAESRGASRTPEGYASAIAGYAREIAQLQERFPVICGEWCLYNSYAATISDVEEKKQFYKELAKQQIDAWNEGAGYFYWSYKLLFDTTKNQSLAGWEGWDLGRSIALGWFPLWE